jgi:hypothetical protein
MDYGKLLGRAWNIIWEHKFLILLGVLVALGSGGGGGGSSGANVVFNRGPQDAPRMPDMPRIPDPGAIAAGVGLLAILIILVALVIALVFWVLATVSRGGLIAGVAAIDDGRASSFSEAWGAGWANVWRLLGIGIIPAIPTFILVVVGLIFGLAAGGLSAFMGEDVIGAPFAGLGVLVAGLACILVPLAVILGLLRTFANRACMLEDLGVLASYRRGLEVLLDNFGQALILFLIQVGISIALAIVGFLPGIVLALCCILWPLLILIQGAIAAYFSSMWTLAWRDWTGVSGVEEAEAEVLV